MDKPLQAKLIGAEDIKTDSDATIKLAVIRAHQNYNAIGMLEDLYQTFLLAVQKRAKRLKQYVTKEWANDLAIAAINLSEGRGTIEEVVSHYDSYASLLENTDCNDLFVTSDFEKLWEKNRRDGGITWRLPFLNKYIGGLRKGDFGFIFARTNIGKTSFIASEISHMIKQVESPVLWVNY